MDHMWNVGDKIAAIVGVISFMQFLALLLTWWLMRDTSNKQLRSYLFPESVSLCDGTMLNPPDQNRAGVPGVLINIRNSGATPAYKVLHWAQIAVLNPQDEHTLAIPKLGSHFATFVNAGGSVNKALWYGRQLTPNEITLLMNGQLAIFVYGKIEYRTLKKKHTTTYRVAYSGRFPPAQGVTFTFCADGNEAD